MRGGEGGPMKYCIHCGIELPGGAAYCPRCGNAVSPLRQETADGVAALISRARIGDQEAIAALYEQTYSKVYYTVRSMVRDEDAVLDILQDSYLKAFSNLDRFEGAERFTPWVKQIAANTARDWLKKKRPLLFSELSAGENAEIPAEELFEDERAAHLPELVVDQAETKRLIREIIEELPEDQRAAIGMFYYEELSVKEIAAAMGATENAVKSRLLYGRRKIEKKVRELEKSGTKLYGLAPIPFLLLLFRGQKAYAAETPNSVVLQTVLRSSAAAAPAAVGAAYTASAAAASASGAAHAVGAAAAGTSALKVALLAVAAVAVIGGGTVGVAQVWRRSASPTPRAVPVIAVETPVRPADAPSVSGAVSAPEAIGAPASRRCRLRRTALHTAAAVPWWKQNTMYLCSLCQTSRRCPLHSLPASVQLRPIQCRHAHHQSQARKEWCSFWCCSSPPLHSDISR